MSATKINFSEIYRRHLTWKRPRQWLDNPQICRISSIIESRTCRTSWGENWHRPGPEILAYFRQHHRHRHRCVCVCCIHRFFTCYHTSLGTLTLASQDTLIWPWLGPCDVGIFVMKMIMIVIVRLVIIRLINTKGTDDDDSYNGGNYRPWANNKSHSCDTNTFIFSYFCHLSFTEKLLIRKYVHPYPLDVTTSQPDKSFTTPPPE